MKRRFFKLTTLLAENSGLTCSCQLGDMVTALQNDDILIHFMLDEEGENVIMQVTVGIIPFHNKDILYENLLQWNNNLSQAHGFSYTINDEEELIILQGIISVSKIDEEYAIGVFSHFVHEYVSSLEKLEDFLQDLALQA